MGQRSEFAVVQSAAAVAVDHEPVHVGVEQEDLAGQTGVDEGLLARGSIFAARSALSVVIEMKTCTAS